MRDLFSNSFRPSLAVVPLAALLLCFYLCASVDEIAYDEPDETIELNGNTVEWDLYDSVDLIEWKLYKYESKVEHPKGHVYLDSLYKQREDRIGDVTTWILFSRTNSNILLYGAGTDTTDSPLNPYHGTYNANTEHISIDCDYMGSWGPFRNNLTVCVKVISDSSDEYFQVIFPTSPRKFYFKQFIK